MNGIKQFGRLTIFLAEPLDGLCFASSEAKAAATSLIPLALKVWSRSAAVRNVKNWFLGALKSGTHVQDTLAHYSRLMRI
jgi:hypothetical protein